MNNAMLTASRAPATVRSEIEHPVALCDGYRLFDPAAEGLRRRATGRMAAPVGRRHRGGGSHRNRTASGFTLIEVVLSLSVLGILLTALGSVLTLSLRAMPVRGGADEHALQVARVFEQMSDDIQSASAITHTDTSLTLTIPDRDGDSDAEIVEYAWRGETRAGLQRRVNAGDWTTVIDNVSDATFSTDQFGSHVMRDTGLVDSPEQLLSAAEVGPSLVRSQTFSASDRNSQNFTVTASRRFNRVELGFAESANPIHLGIRSVRFNDDDDVWLITNDDVGSGQASERSANGVTLRGFWDNNGTWQAASITKQSGGSGSIPGSLLGVSGYSTDDDTTANGVRTMDNIGARERLQADLSASATEVTINLAADTTPISTITIDLYDVSQLNANVSTAAWVSHLLIPALPPDAVSWRPTRLEITARDWPPIVGTLDVALRTPRSDGTPSGTTVGTASITEASLGATYGRHVLQFSGVPSQPATSGLCAVFRAGGGGVFVARVLATTSGSASPGLMAISTNSGGTWTTHSEGTVQHRLWGIVTRNTTMTETVTRVRSIELSLRVLGRPPHSLRVLAPGAPELRP